jgi:hypothetical protein
MSTNLAPIEQSTLPADAWIHSGAALDFHVSHKGRIQQTELEIRVAEFLARGGQVQEIPRGVSGEAIKYNNRVVLGATPRSPFTKDERERHAKAAEAKLRSRAIRGDDEWVAKIAVNLPACDTARELCKVCGFSADKLERLLRTYFIGDQRAIPFLKLTRTRREQLICDRYPLLRHTMSQSDCAKALHVSHCELKRVVALFGLDRLPSLMEAA